MEQDKNCAGNGNTDISNLQEIEKLVRERTIELENLNIELKREVSERKKAEDELEQRTHLLSILLDVSNLVSSTLELGPLLEAILDRLKKIIDYKGAKIFAIEDEAISIVAYRCFLTESEYNNYTFSVVNLPFGKEITLDKKAVVISDIYDDEPRAEEFRKTLKRNQEMIMKNTRSWMGIPLVVKNKVIGILVVEHDEANFYHPRHSELGMVFANQAAIEFENARLYNENARLYQEEKLRHLEDEQRRHVAEGLREILAMLNSNSPIEEIIEFIVKQAGRLMGTDTVALYRFESKKELLSIEASIGLSEEYKLQMYSRLGTGIIGRAVKERKPISVPDINGEHQRYFDIENLRKSHLLNAINRFHGVLAVPLKCKDEIYGGIELYYPQIKAFTSDEIELAMIFADQAALAIDNARLREEAEEMAVALERSRLARDLHDAVTQTLFSASLIAEALPKIWQRSPEEGIKRINEIRELTKGALAEMRTLLLELRPSALTETGIRELLVQLTQAFTGRSRIPVTLSLHGKLALPADIKIVFYRIVQEALNNISKHSGASNVELCLKTSDEEICKWAELTVLDNGKGFQLKGITSDHLGLGIMRERAVDAGAEISINSHIGKGTEIYVKWGKM